MSWSEDGGFGWDSERRLRKESRTVIAEPWLLVRM